MMQSSITDVNTVLPLLTHHFLSKNNAVSSSIPTQIIKECHQYLLNESDPISRHRLYHLIRKELGLTNLTNTPEFPIEKLDQSHHQHDLDHLPKDSVVYMLSRSPSRFYKHTRLLPNEFYQIYKELESAILNPRGFDQLQASFKQGRPRKLHPADELLLWMIHSDGNNVAVISFLFDEISRYCQ